jgi:hypothetical protein
VRAKLLAAQDYLAVAPTVVGVVRDLALGEVDARIASPDHTAADEVAQRWALGTSMTRAVAALDARA